MNSKRDFSDQELLGCLFGGAIGDAIGGVGERGVLSLSDDTQLTLATCESIATLGRAEPGHIAETFLRWFRARRITGMGSAALKALRDLDAGGSWAIAGARGGGCPDLFIDIRKDVMAEPDGPMLRHGLHGQAIHVPRPVELRPSVELLAMRYELFTKAG